jgi:hypothetical protein
MIFFKGFVMDVAPMDAGQVAVLLYQQFNCKDDKRKFIVMGFAPVVT